MTADELLDWAEARLVAANERFGWQGDEDEQAWELLVHALGGGEPELEEQIPAGKRRRFESYIRRRATGEPIAYITGRIDFRDFQLGVKPGMFIPRLTSEFLAEQAIRRLRGRRDPVHVDVATGIGPIALATARAVTGVHAWGLDISRAALNQARANAAGLGLGNVTFIESDVFTRLPARLREGVDVITIHPPYVPRSVVAELPVEIKRFEPRHTLTDGSADGFGLVRRVIDEGRAWLRPGGWLLVEITPAETRLLKPMLRGAGYTDMRSTRGALRQTRVLVARG